MLYVAIWYGLIRLIFMRVKEELRFFFMSVKEELRFFLNTHKNVTYQAIRNCNIKHKNAPEDGVLKSETC